MRQKTDVQLIGTSAVIRDLRAELLRVARCDARSSSPARAARARKSSRAIGANSLRAAAPFVPVNCAGLPENLLESELFGHVKGSFTGAYRDKPGKLEMARNGTIFLDEIGEMTPRMQGLLLRFLETGEIQKVGAEQVAMATNVRVIAATNRNLRDLIAQGLFREDLFFRLNVIHRGRQRASRDILLLVEHFMDVGARVALPPAGECRGDAGITFAGGHGGPAPGAGPQRPPARERRRAAARHRAALADRDRRPAGRGASAGRQPPPQARAAPPTTCSSWSAAVVLTAVYPLYMNREITRANVRDLIHRAHRARTAIVAKLFNLDPQ